MIKKYRIHNKAANFLIELVHDENIPVTIQLGQSHKDFNGDTQIDILLEFEDQNVVLVNEALNKAIQLAISAITL